MNEMWHDEQDVRNALQRIVDTPAPAVRTDVAEVIRRGKRRVLVTRIGAVAGVVVAVAGIGLGTAAISGNLFAGDPTALPPAATSGPPPTTSKNPALDLPGWTQLEQPEPTGKPGAPPTTTLDSRFCIGPQLPLASGRAILPEDRYLPAFEGAIAKTLGEHPAVPFKNYVNANRGHVGAMVKAKQPTSIALEAGRFGGTPTMAADYYRYTYGCVQPLRRTRADGAVLQLFPDQVVVGKQASREIGVYTPNGRFYRITVSTAGFSQSGIDSTQGPGVDKPEQLAVSREQLILIAEAMADLG